MKPVVISVLRLFLGDVRRTKHVQKRLFDLMLKQAYYSIIIVYENGHRHRQNAKKAEKIGRHFQIVMITETSALN